MIYVISILNVIIPILIFIVSVKIDGKGTMGISIIVLGLLYFYLIYKQGHIAVLYNSIPIKISVVIGCLSFLVYNFWNIYLSSKMD